MIYIVGRVDVFRQGCECENAGQMSIYAYSQQRTNRVSAQLHERIQLFEDPRSQYHDHGMRAIAMRRMLITHVS